MNEAVDTQEIEVLEEVDEAEEIAESPQLEARLDIEENQESGSIKSES